MNQQQLKIYNGKIVTPNGIMENGSILVCGKKIIAVNEKNIESENAVTIDAKGKYVAPGFIDIHVHGGGGHDFMDGNETAFLKIAELHARYGTTSMLPTTLTSSKEELLQHWLIMKLQTKGIRMAPSFLVCTSKDLTYP